MPREFACILVREGEAAHPLLNHKMDALEAGQAHAPRQSDARMRYFMSFGLATYSPGLDRLRS